MKVKFLPLIFVLLATTIAAVTQTGTNPDERIVPPRSQARSGQHPRAETAPAQPAASPQLDQQEVEAFRADITRMRVLLNQMRTNLAFVQTSESPLKHEFDLNNDMWQILLSDMERRLQKIDQQRTLKP